MSSDHTDRLGSFAARGALITAGGQGIQLLLQITGVVVLSRMLAPSDFGMLAMITALLTIGQSIRDFGLSNASIQAHSISHQQRSNLFWVNTILGLFLAVILFIASPLVASFYSEPLLEIVTKVLSVTFVLNGLTTQFRAHLARNLAFQKLVVVDVAPALVGFISAVIFANAGAGLWALVSQQIIIAFLGLILAVMFDKWIPGLPKRTDGMGPLIKYGMYLTFSQIVSMVSRNIDFVILGYRSGPATLGFYSRAFELVINPLNQINAPSSKVAVPVLSRLQNSPDKYDRFLVTGQRAMLFILVPFLSAAAVTAYPLIDVFLGIKWQASAPIFQILIIAGIFRVVSYATYWVALSKGATKISFYVNLVSAPLLIICVLIGSQWGALGVAWGFTVGTAITWLISLIWYSFAADAPGKALFMNAINVFAANIVPATLTTLLLHQIYFSSVLKIVIVITCYFITWGVQIYLIPVFKNELKSVQQIILILKKQTNK